jgi:hypothetical protein
MTKYGWTFSIILAADLISTIIVIMMGWGTEANPIMLWFYTNWGLFGLSTVKIVQSAICLGIVEYIWRKNPDKRYRLKYYYIYGILFYIVVYAGMFVKNNLI